MSNSPPSPGPDLFFAGGECLTRFGVWVRRTDMDLEAATGEVATRNSDAEAIGRDGILRTWEPDTPRAEWLNEVDLDPTRNILLNSESLNNTSWGKNSIELTLDDAVAPDGDRSADTYAEDTSANVHGVSQNVASANANVDYTLSVFLKRAVVSRDLASIRVQDSGTNNGVAATFNLALGTVDSPATAFGAGWTALGESIEPIGGGWFRCSISVISDISTVARSDVNIVEPGGAIFYAGDGVSGLHQWGAQLEISQTLTAYQSTPRDTDRRFPSLLLEDTRTNRWTNSESIGVDWSFFGTGLVSDIGTAPDGTVTPDRLFEDASDGLHLASRSIPTHTANSQSVSGYVKAAGRTSVLMQMSDGADSVEATFDLATGTFVGADAGAGAFQGATLRALPNGWFRWTLTGVISGLSTGGTFSCILVDANGALSYQGDGSSGVDTWGWQFEVDVSPSSSYVKTGGATETRDRDVFSGVYTAPPQAASYYLKFVESGTRFKENARLYSITADGGGTPQLRTTAIGGGAFYSSTLSMSAGSSSSGISSQNPIVGDFVEALILVFEDGSLQQIMTINGGDEIVAPRSGSLVLDPAFSGDLLHLNSQGNASNFGFARFLAVKAQRGVRSVDFMRAL